VYGTDVVKLLLLMIFWMAGSRTGIKVQRGYVGGVAIDRRELDRRRQLDRRIAIVAGAGVKPV
jgi:hypothetical protein